MLTAFNRYGAIAAEIYDLDKPVGALPDTDFYLAALAEVRGPILEPACGSGRTMAPLLMAGFDVSGFDPSPDMLARCVARCAAAGFAPPLSQARFDTYVATRAFAAIILPVSSFTLIDTFAAARAAIEAFKAMLTLEGRLILDIQGLSALGDQRQDLRAWTADNGDVLTLSGQRLETDYLRQRIVSQLRYERWREGALIAAEIDMMTQRFWGLEEMSLLLSACGFRDVRVHGDYDRGRAPRRNARTLTFEAFV